MYNNSTARTSRNRTLAADHRTPQLPFFPAISLSPLSISPPCCCTKHHHHRCGGSPSPLPYTHTHHLTHTHHRKHTALTHTGHSHSTRDSQTHAHSSRTPPALLFDDTTPVSWLTPLQFFTR